MKKNSSKYLFGGVAVFLIVTFIYIFYQRQALLFQANDSEGLKITEENKIRDDEKSIEQDKKGEDLKSFFDNKEDYLKAFQSCQNDKRISFSIAPKIGIVSHHFLARDSIACLFDNFSNKDKITRAILIGPDHFSSFAEGKYLFFTTKLNWTTPFGKLPSDKDVINKLLLDWRVSENNSVFQTEHSIYTEVPFLKKSFPQAKIVPLIVKNNFNYKEFEDFAKNILAPMVDENTIIIISSDFIHHSTNAEARKIDKESIEALKELSLKNISLITSDCRACLAMVSGYLEIEDEKGIKRPWRLFANQNSTDFGGEDENVTSYIFGYY